jgi:hypothetical protein
MQVSRQSLISGKIHTMEIPITLAELDAYLAQNVDIQDAFPHLTAEQREFIKTGITPEEWSEHVAAVEEPDDDEPPEGGAL